MLLRRFFYLRQMSSRNREYIVDVLSSAGAKRFAVPSSTEKASFRAFA